MRNVNVPEDDRAVEATPTATEDGIAPSSAAFVLIALGNRMRARVESRLATEGIAIRHLSALGHLTRRPGISYSELARRASVTPQSMQATLNKLEAIGAVERTTSGGRGRTATLFVTEEGKRLLAVGYSSYAELDALLTEHLDMETLNDMMLPFMKLLRSLDSE